MSSPADILTRLTRDPRHFQIAVLSGLLVYGLTMLHFNIGAWEIVAAFAGCIATHFVLSRAYRVPSSDLRSTVISGLGLCLLLRVSAPWVMCLAGMIAVGSKFLIRYNGKHIFNPSNIGIVATIWLTQRAWVSAGQWGTVAVAGLAVLFVAGLMVNRSAKWDVPVMFLCIYAAAIFGRAWWLGDKWAIPIHDLMSGTLIVFAFHMISDPKTTPDARAARAIYVALVVAVSVSIKFGMFRENAFIHALVFCAPIVPLLDRWIPARRYEWPTKSSPTLPQGGEPDEAPSRPRALPVPVPAR